MQGRKATPINAIGDLNFTLKDIQEDRENIRAMMYNDLLKLPLQDRMTTLEVDSRRQEQLALLAPFLMRLEQEYFNKIVERVAGILYRLDIIPPRPEAIPEDMEISVVYDSPLARSMRHANVKAVDAALQFALQLGQVAPHVMDHFDFDAITRGRADDLGVPHSYLLSQQDIEKSRAQRQDQEAQNAQAMQQQQQLMAMKEMGNTVNKVGNTPGMEQLTAQLAQVIQDGFAQASANQQQGMVPGQEEQMV